MSAGSTAAPVKLHYFHGRGRSQQARWALAAARIPFTNVCLSTPEEFHALCESGKLSYNQVPMLEDGALCISQSMTIVRHAARVGNIYGENASDATLIDQVLDGITDARSPIVGFPFMDPQEACNRLHGSVQRYFPHLELLANSGSGSAPFAVGSALSVADVLLAELVQSCHEALSSTFGESVAEQVLQDFPRLRAIHAHVLALPEIQNFMAGPNWFPFPSGAIGKAYVTNVRTVLA